jgi:hypothetical protein
MIPKVPVKRTHRLLATMVVVAAIFGVVAAGAQAGVYEGVPTHIAVQANTGALWILESPEYSNQPIGGGQIGTPMDTVSSPADWGWKTSSGFAHREAVFQGANHDLWEYNYVHSTDLGPSTAMSPGTSPAAIGTEGPLSTHRIIAFQSTSHELVIYQEGGGLIHTGMGMAPGTSPSAAWLEHGGYVIAIHASGTDALWTYSPTLGIVQYQLGLAPGSSPSVAGLTDGSFVVAFHAAGSERLWTVSPTKGIAQYELGIAPGTSPSVIGEENGGFRVAFQGSVTHKLWTYSSTTGAQNIGATLQPGSSPSVFMRGSGLYEIAYQFENNELWRYSSSAGNTSVHFGMMAGTSPSVSG